MTKTTGLGRGLGSLIPNKKAKGYSLQESINSRSTVEVVDDSIIPIKKVPVESVVANPQQPRQIFEHQPMEDLVESIKRHGVIQPILVTKRADGKYELISGERRLRASKMAGKETIPAHIRTADELEKLELALIENIQRHDLNPIELAESYYKLMEEFKLTQEEVSKRLGKKRSTVANNIRLLSLPAEIQKALADRKLTQGHARALLGLEKQSDQLKLFKQIINTQLNVRDTEDLVRSKTHKSYKKTVDPDLHDKKLLLQQTLGTKVDINEKDGKGKIVIHYYSKEELHTIIESLI